MRNKYYTYLDEMKRDKRQDMNMNKKSQRLLTNSFKFIVNKEIDIYFRTEDDIISGHNLSWEGVIGYYHQCFHILGMVERDGREISYRALLQFPGMTF